MIDTLEWLYTELILLYDNWAKWCFITSWEEVKNLAWPNFKTKQLNNNGEEAQIYLKK